MTDSSQSIGLIAGNGKFPLLVLDAARSHGMQVIVAAIKEETFPEIEQHGAAAVHWLSLGELSRLIETFKSEGITQAIMAGQVKHKQIFSSIKPDWRLAKLLLSLTTRNTDSLIGAVSKVLADEGITLMNSTVLLEPMLASRRRSDPTRADRLRADQHHLRPRCRPSPFALRHRADRGNRRSGLRRRRGDGRNGRDHPARRRDHEVAVAGQGAFDPEPRADRGQGRQTEPGHALRRAGGWFENHRDHETGWRYLPCAGRRAVFAAGQRGAASSGQRGRNLRCRRDASQPHPAPSAP